MKKKDKTKETKMGCQKKEYPITNSQLKPAALNSVPAAPTADRWHTAAHRGSPMAENGTKVAQKGAQMAQNGSRRLTKISPNPHFQHQKPDLNHLPIQKREKIRSRICSSMSSRSMLPSRLQAVRRHIAAISGRPARISLLASASDASVSVKICRCR